MEGGAWHRRNRVRPEAATTAAMVVEREFGEECDDAHERTVPVIGTPRRRRKRRGPEVQREEDAEGELLGINGEARDGRSSAADENSG